MSKSQQFEPAALGQESTGSLSDATVTGQITAYREQFAADSTHDLLVRLSKSGVQIAPATFVKMAGKYKGCRAVANAWKLSKTADRDEVAAIVSLLWDNLCPDLFQAEALDALLRAGYETQQERDVRQRESLAEKQRRPGKLSAADETALRAAYDASSIAAVEAWLTAWERLRTFATEQRIYSVDELDERFERWLGESPSNWIQDLEQELENLAWREQRMAAEGQTLSEPDSTRWVKTRLTFIDELRATLPECDGMILFNLRRGQAESHFLLGERETGDALYADLVRDAPDNAWAHIGWGDMYSPQFHAPAIAADTTRAREIYESGRHTVKDERDSLEERIELLDA